MHWDAWPLMIFVTVGASLVGAIVLLRYHPEGTPRPPLWTVLGLHLAAHMLTVAMWGRCQALITFQHLGSQDALVERLVATPSHVLVAAYALVLPWGTLRAVAGR